MEPYVGKKPPYIVQKPPDIGKKRKKGKRRFRIRCPKIKSGKKIYYRNVNLIKKFLSRRTAVIFSRRITKLTFKQQRLLSSAIKQARILALLPFFKYPEKRFTKDKKKFNKKDKKKFNKKYKKKKDSKSLFGP
uniref:ribosomal protein S18 n=1 Tax=Drosera capensis TaxID=4366 RepID=UPI0024116C43|nr:ribosomal protein S18 [Drosera capensis]WEQ03440.1 ribosomal protein S18 [Drosera capensis]